MIKYIQNRPALPLIFKAVGLVTFGAYLFNEFRVRSQRNLARAQTHFGDREIESTVREALRPVISNPGAISIWCVDGTVSLHGDILREEMKTLMATVVAVEGVRKIRPNMTIHDEARGVPALQGRDVWHVEKI